MKVGDSVKKCQSNQSGGQGRKKRRGLRPPSNIPGVQRDTVYWINGPYIPTSRPSLFDSITSSGRPEEHTPHGIKLSEYKKHNGL